VLQFPLEQDAQLDDVPPAGESFPLLLKLHADIMRSTFVLSHSGQAMS
jgi:hypothetical protein